MSTTEAQLRAQLGIPSSAKQVIILASTSHLDWDWLATFEDYYSSNQNIGAAGFENYAVRDIFNNAATYCDENKNNGGQTCTQSNPPQPPPYYYSIAEVGYLQEFAADPAGQFATLQGVGDLLRIVGGGITSPDNLLPHGETLLRNFVIANAWLLTNFPAAPSSGLPALPALRQVWIPDDFGHDAQFPILMEAMGLQGVGFSRIPGDPQQYWSFKDPKLKPSGISGGPDMAAWLLVFGDSNKEHLGTDFIWQASDGSTTLAHFMQAGYFQGAGISSPADIKHYYHTNNGAAPTPYIFVPVGVDFSLPVQKLVEYACEWNAKNLSSKGIYAVAATFDHYIQLVSCYPKNLLTRSSNPDMSTTFPFVPAPYWTGVYGSRPEIKIQHHQATRKLLGAELYDVIANFQSVSGVDDLQDLIAAGWSNLTPSTHHDYITGTAANSVYYGEQLPLLANAIVMGNSALTSLQESIAAQIKVSPVTNQIAATVFNQLGFARGGLVEMEPVSGFTPVAFGNDSGLLGPVQISSDGKWLFCIPTDETSIVPALGYNTYYLTSDTSVKPPAYNPQAVAHRSLDEKKVSMSNVFFSAEAKEKDGWGLASFDEKVGGPTSPVLQGPANQAIYLDEGATGPGDMYKFATEFDVTLDTVPASFTATSVEVVESGPVRAKVLVEGNYVVNNQNQQFTREYLIVVDEPFLRMKATSTAPEPYSAFVMFPLSTGKDIDSMIHGTSYHWDTKPSQPVVNTYRGWQPPIFSATHDFVMPSSAGKILGAIYHSYLPAWAITGDNNSLIGCLLRNPVNDKDPNQAAGDPDSHTLEYALRVPAGLSDPTSTIPQHESLSYSTPLQALVAGGSSGGSLSTNFSMASLSASNAYITAVKQGTVTGPALGQIVIRVYQPTLQGQQLTLTLPEPPAGQQWQASGITALETPLSAAKTTTLNVTVNGNQISFFAERAITTLAVSLIQNQ